jgi:hypothetical protein
MQEPLSMAELIPSFNRTFEGVEAFGEASLHLPTRIYTYPAL